MAPLLLLLLLLLLPSSSFAGPISTEFLYPNSTFTPLHFVDHNGAFLSSLNSTFVAAFLNPGSQQSRYYLVLLYSPSNSLVWSANPNSPVPAASTFSLSSSGLSLRYPNGSIAWSTPQLSSPVKSLRLLDSGNLLLLDSKNSSLWQSYDYPTDTLLPGQRLLVGSSLASPLSDSDLSDGGYRLFVTTDDAVMRWKGLQQYWSLSTDPYSVKDYNAEVSYMAINDDGFYLFDVANRTVFQVTLSSTNGFRVGKLDSTGRFRIVSYSSTRNYEEFVAPSNDCDLPLSCNSLGLCTAGANQSTCSCPGLFGMSAAGGCLPVDGSVLAAAASCGGSSLISYLSLGNNIGYFANKFSTPITTGKEFSSCQSLCFKNCSCLGFFYENSSKSCYLLENQLGSLTETGYSSTTIGYIKTLKSSSPSSTSNSSHRSSSTNVVAILLPSIATILLLLILSFVGFHWWRKRSHKNGILMRSTRPMKEIKLGRPNSLAEDESADGDVISIPGLPTRFTCADLAAATDNFRIQIGSGGFGTVYKGELPDKTLVAIKKITNIGIQGKREFCTEIAVIGKIHHVNLVKLRGYCAQGSDRMLVYEYMNRGSLDRSLFVPGPALEWKERLKIAVGAARGLAYLHSGCDHKIIHCDIKPENILLADHGQVKIADFGMAKLISPEQSGFFTTMRGTRGYLAPEWLTNSAISDKTDVYSYGMVLLEIINGRKNRSDSTGLGSNCYFPMVAVQKHVEGRWLELADPRMEGRVTGPEVERAVRVALCCLHEEPGMRPSMAAVVGMLEGTTAVWEPRVEALGFLRVYQRAFGEVAEGVIGGGNYAESVTSTTSGSSITYISSHQLSGPR